MPCYVWSELPISESVIYRVHIISKEKGQSLFLNGELRYKWINGEMENNYNSEYYMNEDVQYENTLNVKNQSSEEEI